MGYFSNGMEGMIYESQYCDKCVYSLDTHGCPIWGAHLMWNYDECNKKDSVLHKMIPRDNNGENMECIFFIKRN